MIGRKATRQGSVRSPKPRSLLALLSGYELLRTRMDAQNVDRLRAELGCSLDEARRLYSLAREHGFGAAYEMVFGAPPKHARRRPIPVPGARRRLAGLTSRRGHPAQPS